MTIQIKTAVIIFYRNAIYYQNSQITRLNDEKYYRYIGLYVKMWCLHGVVLLLDRDSGRVKECSSTSMSFNFQGFFYPSDGGFGFLFVGLCKQYWLDFDETRWEHGEREKGNRVKFVQKRKWIQGSLFACPSTRCGVILAKKQYSILILCY